MALSLLNFTTILSLIVSQLFLLVALHPQTTSSLEEDEEEYYVLDFPTPTSSRFLASKNILKKGCSCNPTKNNKCNGIAANNGTALLYCCKNNCRNILRDKNNCGKCGVKCKFGLYCCHRSCINLQYDPHNCGMCGKRCAPGKKCEYGICGYN